jgi:hypothetical protein
MKSPEQTLPASLKRHTVPSIIIANWEIPEIVLHQKAICKQGLQQRADASHINPTIPMNVEINIA